MSSISKIELKKQIRSMGIEVEGDCVRKKDIGKIIDRIVAYMGKNEKFLVTSVAWLKKSIKGDKQAILKVLNELSEKLSGQGVDEKDPSVIEAFSDLEFLLGSLKDPMFSKPVKVLLSILKDTGSSKTHAHYRPKVISTTKKPSPIPKIRGT